MNNADKFYYSWLVASKQHFDRVNIIKGNDCHIKRLNIRRFEIFCILTPINWKKCDSDPPPFLRSAVRSFRLIWRKEISFNAITDRTT
jgi:hypothetical protein